MTSKMMIPDNPNLIEHTAQEFWALAGAPGGAGETGETGELPCDIRTAITLVLSLEVYPVPALRVSHIFDWTRRTGVVHRIRGRDRRLHGCLLADRGKGTIFEQLPPLMRGIFLSLLREPTFRDWLSLSNVPRMPGRDSRGNT
jgi:hypothetical protein